MCVCVCFFFWGGGWGYLPFIFPRDGTNNNIIRVATGEISSRINVGQSQVFLLEKKSGSNSKSSSDSSLIARATQQELTAY